MYQNTALCPIFIRQIIGQSGSSGQSIIRIGLVNGYGVIEHAVAHHGIFSFHFLFLFLLVAVVVVSRLLHSIRLSIISTISDHNAVVVPLRRDFFGIDVHTPSIAVILHGDKVVSAPHVCFTNFEPRGVTRVLALAGVDAFLDKLVSLTPHRDFFGLELRIA